MRSTHRPPFLSPGDRIGLLAPARKISKVELAPALKVIEQWGLEPVLGKNIFGERNQYSGSDRQRLDDLQQMLNDSSICAILPVRGGYGALRIIDRLDFDQFSKNPKWICGYSDMTVLHAHIHELFMVETLHSTMPISFAKDEESAALLRDALFGKIPSYTWSSNFPGVEGEASGQLIGGNLSLLYALKGSGSFPDTTGKILFIEDLDEYLYHIDRMMLSLKRTGIFEHLAGVIVGGMTEMKDNPVPFGSSSEQIILEHLGGFGYPICFDFPAGHGQKNYPLFFGREAKLSSSHNNSLSFS